MIAVFGSPARSKKNVWRQNFTFRLIGNYFSITKDGLSEPFGPLKHGWKVIDTREDIEEHQSVDDKLIAFAGGHFGR